MQLQLRHLQWKKGTTWAKTTKNYKRRSISQTAKSCISCCIYNNSWLGDGIFLPHYIFGRRHNIWTPLCSVKYARALTQLQQHLVTPPNTTASAVGPTPATHQLWKVLPVRARLPLTDSRFHIWWGTREEPKVGLSECVMQETPKPPLLSPPPLAIHRAEDMVLHSHSEREREKHNEVRGTKVLLTTMWAPPKPHFDLNLW